MKNFFLLIVGTIILTACNSHPKKVEVRQRIKLDRDWRFHLSDVENAEKLNFQDQEWRNIALSGRWYTGSGIYRHVWLKVTNPIHVKHWGTFVTTPEVKESLASIKSITEIINESSTSETVHLETKILDRTGKVRATTTSFKEVENGRTVKFEHKLEVEQPQLWSSENPYLYAVVNIVKKGNSIIDTFHTPLGIRKLEFSEEEGFKLSDVNTKFKGICLHHAAGTLGAAVPNDVLYRRLKLLKDMGTNAPLGMKYENL